MITQSFVVTTRPVFYGEIDQLIRLDDQTNHQFSQRSKQPLPPSLTYIEISHAISTDCLEWIFIGKELAGYYWFRKQANYLDIATIVIHEEFAEKNLHSTILIKAEKQAEEWGLTSCRLALDPQNPALMSYFKQQYQIVSSVQDFFGPALPNIFRLIMEKNLHCQKKEFSEETKTVHYF